MKNQSTTKSWIIIAIVIVIAVVVYYSFFSAPAADVGTLGVTGNGQMIGADVLALLNQLQALKIDTSFFQNPAYASLNDYTVVIPTDAVGRPNPFAPIPGVKLVLPSKK